jgi:uncharacterized protein (TIGR00297 family)
MTLPIITSQQIWLGFGLAVTIGVLGYIARSLAVSGMISAIVIGTVIFVLGGLPWAALMITFFLTSSLLSKLFSVRKRALSDKFEKGSRRDWAQVLANGGTGAFMALIALLFPQDVWPWLAFAGAMATVNADTWATEIGILSPTEPRLITTGQRVPMGTSGGITLVGTTATAAGGFLIGLVGLLFQPGTPVFGFLTAVTLAGLIGSLVDSLLGGTVQAIYYDPERQKETERQVIGEDGQPTAPVHGWVWMNNDMVNFLSSVCGALAAVVLWEWLN